MKQTILLSVFLWALFVTPLLCQAGVLPHACVGCEADEFCTHEEECPSDPCGEVALHSARRAAVRAAHALTGVLVQDAFPGVFTDELPAASLPEVTASGPPPSVRFESDLPLLI